VRLIPCSTCHLFVSAKKCQPISGRVTEMKKSPHDAGFLPNAADAAGAAYDQRSWLIAVR
ncbi:hypothetical protein, partial [Burkholderia multivorans]|uniref:hypothetical protein n=1 Tax=Burkholderia multivorans TaxID=87883 RepID=UPI001C615A3B